MLMHVGGKNGFEAVTQTDFYDQKEKRAKWFITVIQGHMQP